jgi:hypothetical protein
MPGWDKYPFVKGIAITLFRVTGVIVAIPLSMGLGEVVSTGGHILCAPTGAIILSVLVFPLWLLNPSWELLHVIFNPVTILFWLAVFFLRKRINWTHFSVATWTFLLFGEILRFIADVPCPNQEISM